MPVSATLVRGLQVSAPWRRPDGSSQPLRRTARRKGRARRPGSRPAPRDTRARGERDIRRHRRVLHAPELESRPRIMLRLGLIGGRRLRLANVPCVSSRVVVGHDSGRIALHRPGGRSPRFRSRPRSGPSRRPRHGARSPVRPSRPSMGRPAPAGGEGRRSPRAGRQPSPERSSRRECAPRLLQARLRPPTR